MVSVAVFPIKNLELSTTSFIVCNCTNLNFVCFPFSALFVENLLFAIPAQPLCEKAMWKSYIFKCKGWERMKNVSEIKNFCPLDCLWSFINNCCTMPWIHCVKFCISRQGTQLHMTIYPLHIFIMTFSNFKSCESCG